MTECTDKQSKCRRTLRKVQGTSLGSCTYLGAAGGARWKERSLHVGADKCHPAFAQMDIEGWEWDVLAAMGTERGSEWRASLPDQLAIEFHIAKTTIYQRSPSHLNASDFGK
jgi:hypothetical protein